MVESLLDTLTYWWSVADTSRFVKDADLIVPIGYTTHPNRLTYGTLETTFRSTILARIHPQAVICFANTCHTFAGADKVERNLKIELLYKNGVAMERIHSAGPITNSIEEAEAIRCHLARDHIRPKNIILIVGTTHARRVYHIWKKIFPEANIFIYNINRRFETETYHPQKLLRGQWKCLSANVAHYCALRVFGLNIVKKFRQPIARS